MHLPGIYSYKMDYPRMFLWNPAYSRVSHEAFPHPSAPGRSHDDEDNRVAVTLMRKSMEAAFPARTDAGVRT